MGINTLIGIKERYKYQLKYIKKQLDEMRLSLKN